MPTTILGNMGGPRSNRNEQPTMEIGGTTRYYVLDVPESSDNQTPLVLIFGLHGYDMNVAWLRHEQRRGEDLYNFTERSNGQAVTVMPQGEGPPLGDVSHWGDGVLESTWTPNQANYDYLQALMTTLLHRHVVANSGRSSAICSEPRGSTSARG